MPGKHREGYHKEWKRKNKDKVKEYQKKANAKRDPEKVRKYNRDRKHKSPERWLVWISRARAKKKDIEHTITDSDVIIPDVCPVLNIPIKPTDGSVSSSSPTLDRVDPSKGYVPGNVAVISHRANQIKSDSSIEDIRALLKYMESNLVS